MPAGMIFSALAIFAYTERKVLQEGIKCKLNCWKQIWTALEGHLVVICYVQILKKSLQFVTQWNKWGKSQIPYFLLALLRWSQYKEVSATPFPFCSWVHLLLKAEDRHPPTSISSFKILHPCVQPGRNSANPLSLYNAVSEYLQSYYAVITASQLIHSFTLLKQTV